MPSDIREGSCYHVKQTRDDGWIEETIKTLARGGAGRWWRKPESTAPEQAWTRVERNPGVRIELIRRVRFSVLRENMAAASGACSVRGGTEIRVCVQSRQTSRTLR